jgi:flagellar biosynthesis activator protein FlaF
MSVNIYNKNQKAQAVPNGNSRDTDARALLACARRLDDAKILMTEDAKSKENLRLCAEAIRHNQRLWTIFQVALADPQNPLPENLKLILLNLSRYVDKTSFRAIGKYAPDLLDSLININRIIASGLSKQSASEGSYAPPVDMRETPTSLTTSA